MNPLASRERSIFSKASRRHGRVLVSRAVAPEINEKGVIVDASPVEKIVFKDVKEYGQPRPKMAGSPQPYQPRQ